MTLNSVIKIRLGTIINYNQVLRISFKAQLEEYDLLLPTFQYMIDSFKIRSIGIILLLINNNPSITEFIENEILETITILNDIFQDNYLLNIS